MGGDAMSSVGSEKAFFVNEDGGSPFYVQFNPKELSLKEAATWKVSKEFKADVPLVEFEKGTPAKLSMELIFDTTDSGKDVRDEWTSKLAAFVAVNFKDETVTHNGVRPPRCTFKWGSLEFPAVIDSIDTTFIMFASNGNPLRAKVAIKLTERLDKPVGGTGKSAGVTLSAPVSAFGGQSNSRTEAAKISAVSNDGSSAADQGKPEVGTNTTQTATGFTGVSTYTVQEGDTLSGIALFLSIEFWWIAAANNIEDPMNLTPGDTLVIPPSQQCAEIFQHLPPEDNWYWGDYDPQLNPDSDLADIFAIYDGEWDPFAEQELEDLGAETALEVGVGDQVSGDWAMSEYEGQAPDATVFERPDEVDSSFERIAAQGDGAQAMEAGPELSQYGGSAVESTTFDAPDASVDQIEAIGADGDGAKAMEAGPELSQYEGTAVGASTFDAPDASVDQIESIGADGDGAKAMAAGPGVANYESDRPDASKFEHGESSSSDIFSLYSPSSDDEQQEAAVAGSGSNSSAMERPSEPAAAASTEAAPTESDSNASAAPAAPNSEAPKVSAKDVVKKAADTVSRANRNRGNDDD